MKYIDIINSDFFNYAYSTIEELKKDFPVNHGFIHVNHVIENAKKCAKVFNLSEEEERLLLIASALHDIGYLKGRENHAGNGAILAREVLKKSGLNNSQIDVICTAIANHGGDELSDFNNKISMCLILADKLDFVESRYRRDIEPERYQVFFNILKTDISFDNKKLNVKVLVTDKKAEEKFKERSFYEKVRKCFSLAAKSLNAEENMEFEVLEKAAEEERNEN